MCVNTPHPPTHTQHLLVEDVLQADDNALEALQATTIPTPPTTLLLVTRCTAAVRSRPSVTRRPPLPLAAVAAAAACGVCVWPSARAVVLARAVADVVSDPRHVCCVQGRVNLVKHKEG